MNTTDTFRINRIEHAFLERWASGDARPGAHTPDGGLLVLEDGGLAMGTGESPIRIADLHEGHIVILMDGRKNPVYKAYNEALEKCTPPLIFEDIFEGDNLESLTLQLAEAASSAASDSLKQLAASNRPVLKHLITLHKAYRGDDPQLQSKEAKTAMQAILHSWDSEDIEAAHMFGRVNWEPDPIAWMSFFDEVGSQPLGKAIGLQGPDSIPDVPGSEFEVAPGDQPEEPEYNHDDNEPESDAFDAGTFLQ